MSQLTTLKSYLVSLGFDSNMGQFHSNFEKPIQAASALVKKETFGIAGDVLKWQGSIVGMFAAISAGVLHAMDKVAMADQEYRLFGERMFMDTAHARNLKIALDALGEPLEAIAFDPELHDRFMQLQAEQKEITKGLGGDYEANMKKIRDVRFEFTRMKVELQYLTMGGVNAIFKALGADSDDLLTNLRKFNDWIIHNIPYLSDQFAKYLVPILRTTKQLFLEIWEDVKMAAVVFQNFVGMVSGDKSIEGQTASFEKFAKSIEHVIGWLGNLAHWIGQTEGVVLHLLTALQDLMSGDTAGALKELKGALGNINAGSGATIGTTIGSFIEPGGGTVIGGAIGGGLGWLNQKLNPDAAKQVTVDDAAAARSGQSAPFVRPEWATSIAVQGQSILQQPMALARKVGADTGIPANIIFDQWAHETNDFTNRGARQLNNLAGINVPGGKGQDYLSFASLDDFAKYFEGLLRSQRYAGQGVLDAKTIEAYAEALKKGGYYGASQKEYTEGMRYREQEHHTSTTIDVGGIYITQPNATPQQIQAAVQGGIENAQGKEISRMFPQVQGVY